jgi:hypothetical protein
MPRFLAPLLAALATLLGVAGLWTGLDPLSHHAPWLVLLGGGGLALLAPMAGFCPPGVPWPRRDREPRRLELGRAAWLKVPVMWMAAFHRSYAVEPGLYHTGEAWNPEAPLLVTGNYLLSVLSVVRAVGERPVRLLVVDTDGINVWCASGKGRFSAETILVELDRYDPALLGERPTLILPKLGLSGVKLGLLRKLGYRPIIGPVHARDLPAWLDHPPLKHRTEDRVLFGWRARAFAWMPGLLQYLGYAAMALLGLLGVEALGGPSAPVGMLGIVAWLGTAYPLLFPYIPGRRFAIKGLWLGGLTAAALAAAGWFAGAPATTLAATALFTLAFAIFVGLSFTGNSAVSNYSEVRKEIAQFLPVDVILFLAALATFLLSGASA